MRCPYCNNHVLQKSGDQIRLRTQGQIVFDEQGVCHAKCYWCKALVEIPIEIQDGTSISSERFFLRKS